MKNVSRTAASAALIVLAMASGCKRRINDGGEALIETRLVSKSSAGQQAFGSTTPLSLNAVISGNGQFVAFVSAAPNLVAGKISTLRDVFRQDLLSGQTIRVSLNSTGGDPDGACDNPSISDDGNRIAFDSFATNIDGADASAAPSIYVRDVNAATTTLVSRPTGVAGNGDGNSQLPKISGDGRSVAFVSSATNLDAAVGGGPPNHIYVRRLADYPVTPNTTLLVSRASDISAVTPGAPGGAASGGPSISGDGRFVAFRTDSTNLDGILADTNGARDVYRRDTVGPPAGFPTTIRVSLTSAGGEVNGNSDNPSISADGNLVAFDSLASNLVPGDFNAARDIFRKNILTGEIVLVSLHENGGLGTGGSQPAISADGRFVVFTANGPLVASDTNGIDDIYQRDVDSGTTIRISVGTHGAQAVGASGLSSISLNTSDLELGVRVVFESDAANLVDADVNGKRDIFVRGRFR